MLIMHSAPTRRGKAAAVASGTNTAAPSVYDLELVSPRGSGTAPITGAVTMPSGHRIFKAYPGIEYNIKAVVMGGSYPYTFALSNAPEGMTVNASTGEISWPDPQSTATDVVLTVTDAEDTEVTGTWTITVGTTGFKFFSPTGDDTTGDGSLASPWQTLAKAKASTAGNIVYFRSGTYDYTGISTETYGSEAPHLHNKAGWSEGTSSVQLLAYPGETVVFDHGGTEDVSAYGVMVEVTSQGYSSTARPIYFENIHFRNVDNCLLRLQVNGHFHIFRGCTFSHIYQPWDGDNPGGIMCVNATADFRRQYCAFQDCIGSDNLWNVDTNVHGAGLFKLYGFNKVLIEGCEVSSGSIGDPKAHTSRFEYRGNWIHDNSIPDGSEDKLGIEGNMAGTDANGRTYGEIRYNRVTARGATNNTVSRARACSINNFNQSPRIDIYRNTFVGQVSVESTCLGVDVASCGPFNIHSNVIINDNNTASDIDGVYFYYVATGPDVTYIGTAAGAGCYDNLVAGIGSGTVNEAGDLALTGSARTTYLGTHGHEIP